MTSQVAIRVGNTTNEKPTLINTHLQASIKFWCEMEFWNYPFDVQVFFFIESAMLYRGSRGSRPLNFLDLKLGSRLRTLFPLRNETFIRDFLAL